MRPYPKGNQAGSSVSPPFERAFLRLRVPDLAWPASTSCATGQVDFIRLADLTLIEPAKQEVPNGKSELGWRSVDQFFFRSRTVPAHQ